MTAAWPDAFLRRMRGQLGAEFSAFERASRETALRGVRFCPDRAPELARRLSEGLTPIPWADHAFYLPFDSDLGKTVTHEAGLFYLQEPSAMIPAAILDARPGEILLDLCGAPGGKATQIGAAMRGEGLLVCNEIVPQRARVLSRNVERMGLLNAVVTNESPERLAEKWPEGFDGVLVDAPCSGEGMFRRDPETVAEWQPERAAGCAERQKAILRSAAAMVRPGGRLVYSTCTFHPEENEGVVRWFLQTFPGFSAAPFSLNGADGSRGWETFYPHRIRGEGQFAALFFREGTGEAGLGNASHPLGREDRKKLESFLPPGLPELHRLGRTAVSLPVMPDLAGIRVLRCGLQVAELRDGYAVPDHALALSGLALPAGAREMSGEEAVRYMAGEALAAEGAGWMTASYQGLSLGWGKASQGIFKNHYPKGLRKNHLLP